MSVSLVDIATKSRLRPGNTSPGEGAWGAKGTHSLTDKGAPPSHSCLLCVNARVLSTNDRYVGRNVAAVSDTYTLLHCSMCFAALRFPLSTGPAPRTSMRRRRAVPFSATVCGPRPGVRVEAELARGPCKSPAVRRYDADRASDDPACGGLLYMTTGKYP